jgi:hypothetical protein
MSFIILTKTDGHKIMGHQVRIAINQIKTYENSETRNFSWVCLKGHHEGFKVLESAETIDKLIKEKELNE